MATHFSSFYTSDQLYQPLTLPGFRHNSAPYQPPTIFPVAFQVDLDPFRPLTALALTSHRLKRSPLPSPSPPLPKSLALLRRSQPSPGPLPSDLTLVSSCDSCGRSMGPMDPSYNLECTIVVTFCDLILPNVTPTHPCPPPLLDPPGPHYRCFDYYLNIQRAPCTRHP